jgi:cell fate (sporulation/competence/biofilm development) regulator YlbF (YheA/YmcA/DUF963 family)
MTTTTAVSALDERLQALCFAIADNPEVKSARSIAEGFLEDEQGVALYRDFMSLGRELHMREQNGESVTDEESARFVELRSKADAHEGIAAFTSAQDYLQGIANKVSQYVSKTLQNGSVPSEEEMDSGGCCGGGGCGCH